MKTLSRLLLIIFIILLVNIGSTFAWLDETDGCAFIAEAGAYGTYEFTWGFATNGTINDYIGLGGNDVHFKAGDTVIVEVLDGYQAATSSAVLSLVPGGSVSTTIPGTMSYTFTEDLIADARLGGNWGALSLPHGTMLLKFRFNCVSAEYSQDAEVGPPDSRFNWQSGDAHIAILYPSGDSIGVYLYETDTFIYNFVTQAQLDSYVDNLPESNTLLNSEGSVSVYILTTGQIQFNLGPDVEGKTYTIIMDDLSGTNMTTSYYDPNE